MTKNSLMAVSVLLGLNLDLGRNGLESKVRFFQSPYLSLIHQHYCTTKF